MKVRRVLSADDVRRLVPSGDLKLLDIVVTENLGGTIVHF